MSAKEILWTRGARFFPVWELPEAARAPEARCNDERYAPDWGSVERCGMPRGHGGDKHASYLRADYGVRKALPMSLYSTSIPVLIWARPTTNTACLNCGAEITYNGDHAEWVAMPHGDVARHHNYTNVCDVPGGHRPVTDGHPYVGVKW